MSGLCDGRVVIVTGAGGGLGRCHALAFARAGATVVVNDPGVAADGSGSSAGPAETVAREILAAGGEAVANTDDVASWDGAQRLVAQALGTFGRLDVLVNNADILRDRTLVDMSEAEWDAVVAVHLKGTLAPSHFAARHWRDRSETGARVDARIITTTSRSGLSGNAGQVNHGAAEAGIAALTLVAAQELGRYGVTVNAIAPTAPTRPPDLPGVDATEDHTGSGMVPEHVAPLAVWLGSARSRSVTGRVFGVRGPRVSVAEGWAFGPSITGAGVRDPEVLGELVLDLVAKAVVNANTVGDRQ
jgi:NAD(P)-dependent dehydrogenase (short-subunit alcohol dehydrogenase family)